MTGIVVSQIREVSSASPDSAYRALAFVDGWPRDIFGGAESFRERCIEQLQLYDGQGSTVLVYTMRAHE